MNTQLRQTSTLAIVCLVFGVLAWTVLPFLGAIIAIITGHMARGEIRRDPDLLEGDVMAVIGLVLGYLSLLFGIAVLAFVLFWFGLLAFLA